MLNGDDPAVAAMATRTAARVVLVGTTGRAEVRAEDITLDRLGRASFELVTGAGRVKVGLRLSGEHQVGNALAAAAVGLECGLALTDTGAALSEARPVSHWRMEIVERPDGVVVVNDAYNANPESMRAALKTLAVMARGRRSWAVLGPMGELGELAVAEHDALGRLAVRLNVNVLVAVGVAARPIAQGASLEGSYNGEAVWVETWTEAADLLEPQLRAGDVVLVKASRAAGFERLAARLAQAGTTP